MTEANCIISIFIIKMLCGRGNCLIISLPGPSGITCGMPTTPLLPGGLPPSAVWPGVLRTWGQAYPGQSAESWGVGGERAGGRGRPSLVPSVSEGNTVCAVALTPPRALLLPM